MRFLCTNDDGILAHGLDCLVKAAGQIGEVTVVAPDREQSATSHSLTLHHPVRPVKRGERRWQVDGTPTDCVILGVQALMAEKPDFVLSGVNHGPNLGEDVLYSGTVAAAMEGLACGIPSIAFSFAGSVLRADVSLLEHQVEFIATLLKHLTSLDRIPKDTLLNVNLPPLRGEKVEGVRLTRLGTRHFSDSLQKMLDPWGREIYWIGGGQVHWTGTRDDSDIRAIQDGFVSVTPLHLDLTHHRMIADAGEWWRDL